LPNALAQLKCVFLLPHFCCNPLYVVQQYGTTATSMGDFHNDLHRSVQKVCSPKENPLYIVLVLFPGVLLYFTTCSKLNRHKPETVVIYFPFY
jgi:hypothetical protein